jgi:preprotein translocase subunit SecB
MANPETEFQVHKMYLKDASFEAPTPIKSFQTDWAPELNIQIANEATALAEKDTHEVVLKTTATVKTKGELAFEVNVDYAGIFTLTGLNAEQAAHTLGAYAPSLMYPYVREVISDLVSKGGFPQLALAPINFDILYQQQAEANAKAGTDADNVVELKPAKKKAAKKPAKKK